LRLFSLGFGGGYMLELIVFLFLLIPIQIHEQRSSVWGFSWL
jgi:hypothetical protein